MVFGDRLRQYLGITLEAPDAERLAFVQQILNRNTILAAGRWILIAAAGGAIGGVAGNIATEMLGGAAQAAEWLSANADAVIVFGQSWGEWASGWLVALIREACEVVAALESIRARDLRDPRR